MLKWCVSGWHRFQPEQRSLGALTPPPSFIRGCDPLLQTARGKLQNRRCKLNEEISRQLRIRAGAENLYKVCTAPELRRAVESELREVNSRLQALKEDLWELNSDLQVYQYDGRECEHVSMVTLGLKETADTDFAQPIIEAISEHYKEAGTEHEAAIHRLHHLRQASRTPARSQEGLDLLHEYYNCLYFVDKRFCPPHEESAFYFEWYDSFTGVPSAQRTVAFEKACILYNLGALHSQLGAKQERSCAEGMRTAQDHFRRAAGAFDYLVDHFSAAPSLDMKEDTLHTLHSLMMAQAQECTFELRCQETPLPSSSSSSSLRPLHQLTLAGEAAQVREQYSQCLTLMTDDAVKDYLPPSWITMASIKEHYYAALAHHLLATAFTTTSEPTDSDAMKTAYQMLHGSAQCDCNNNNDSQCLTKDCTSQGTQPEDKTVFGRAHLRQSVLRLEDALRLQISSKLISRAAPLTAVLRRAHSRSLEQFALLEEEDDFSELFNVCSVTGNSTEVVDPMEPDLCRDGTEDPFHRLGPLHAFSARHVWSRPRCVALSKAPEVDNFGFSVRGDSPVTVDTVQCDSLAERAGMKSGDFLVKVGSTDVRWLRHPDVVALLQEAGCALRLTLVTPLARRRPLTPGRTRRLLANRSTASSSSSASRSPGGSQPSPLRRRPRTS